MAITSLTYEAPVRRSARQTTPDYERLEEAATLSDEGRPVESLTKVFEHFFPSTKLPNLQTEGFAFTQGSSKVSTRIEGDDVVISVPLVRLPQGGSAIAALRHVLTEISASGQLYQPRLRGDDIHLEYRDRLARLHPAKVVEVLRRMPMEADGADDFLIGQFSAQPLERAPIGELDAGEVARSEKIWKSHWADVEELLKECQRKRSIFFLNELTAWAFYRIAFALPLCGFINSRLEDAASVFNDSDEDPMRRESSLAKCIKEMKAVSTEDLKKSLGHASYAISPFDDGTPQVLDGHIGPGHYLDTIDKLRTQGKPMDATLALVSTFTYLLARFSWPDEIEKELRAALEKASGKPWREAAQVLLEDAKAIAAKYGDDDEGDDDDEESDDDDTDEDSGDEDDDDDDDTDEDSGEEAEEDEE